jgi:hypothetical protein
MTLAPIRGAPPGAYVPAFPAEERKAVPAQLTATPGSDDLPQISPLRQRHTPIEIDGGGIKLRFRVMPEIPAICRASMTIHVVAGQGGSSSTDTVGFLRMSAANARAFLTDLQNGRSPTAATGDEDGTVEIECEMTEAGPVFSVRKPVQRDALHRCIINQSFDMKAIANELLADLGL